MNRRFSLQIQLSVPQTLFLKLFKQVFVYFKRGFISASKSGVKTLVTTLDRDWRFQQGVCTSSAHFTGTYGLANWSRLSR